MARRTDPRSELLPEAGGDPRTSYRNAEQLITDLGLPDTVELMIEPEDPRPIVEATWDDGRLVHHFDGFSWGYQSWGVEGLMAFFELIGMRPMPSLEEVRSWRFGFPSPKEWSPRPEKVVRVRGEDYGFFEEEA
jgi:hypothetical protein